MPVRTLVNDTRTGKLAGGKGEAQLVGACQQRCYPLEPLADGTSFVQFISALVFGAGTGGVGGVAVVRTLLGR